MVSGQKVNCLSSKFQDSHFNQFCIGMITSSDLLLAEDKAAQLAALEERATLLKNSVLAGRDDVPGLRSEISTAQALVLSGGYSYVEMIKLHRID